MKRLPIASALALGATVALSASALAWHVETDPGSQEYLKPKVSARSAGPAGDPYHRVVVKVGEVRLTECIGSVRVPDEKWATGTTLTVDGTDVAIGRGESAALPVGEYVGRWSNSKEVEHFAIKCRPFDIAAVQYPVRVNFRFIGKTGERVISKYVDPGCTYRSPWVWMKGGSKFWVQDTTNGKRLLTQRAAPAGYYPPLWRGFAVGVTCQS